jgi:hypothetical protein
MIAHLLESKALCALVNSYIMQLHLRQNPATVGCLKISKSTELLARVAADEFRKLLEDASSPIFGVDSSGIIDIWCNRNSNSLIKCKH